MESTSRSMPSRTVKIRAETQSVGQPIVIVPWRVVTRWPAGVPDTWQEPCSCASTTEQGIHTKKQLIQIITHKRFNQDMAPSMEKDLSFSKSLRIHNH